MTFALPAVMGGIDCLASLDAAACGRRGAGDDSAVRDYFGSTVALLFVAVGRFGSTDGLKIWVEIGDRADIELERRILGLTASAAIVVVGNGLPKILTPLAISPPDEAARVTAARRFIGLVWVTPGSTTAVTFLFAPLISP